MPLGSLFGNIHQKFEGQRDKTLDLAQRTQKWFQKMMVSRDTWAPKPSNAGRFWIYVTDLISNSRKVHREMLNKNSKMLSLEVHDGFKGSNHCRKKSTLSALNPWQMFWFCFFLNACYLHNPMNHQSNHLIV